MSRRAISVRRKAFTTRDRGWTNESAMRTQTPETTVHPSVDREPFGQLPDGRLIDAITLSNSGRMHVRVLTFGGIIQALHVPDRDGKLEDVVLGYDALSDYLNDTRYFGAIVGRY